MNHLGPIDLTLIYSSPGLETPIAASLRHSYALFQRTWTVLLDQPINFGNGLIRAEITLPDGRRFAGAVRRPSALGSAFDLIEDGQPLPH